MKHRVTLLVALALLFVPGLVGAQAESSIWSQLVAGFQRQMDFLQFGSQAAATDMSLFGLPVKTTTEAGPTITALKKQIEELERQVAAHQVLTRPVAQVDKNCVGSLAPAAREGEYLTCVNGQWVLEPSVPDYVVLAPVDKAREINAQLSTQGIRTKLIIDDTPSNAVNFAPLWLKPWQVIYDIHQSRVHLRDTAWSVVVGGEM
jgi:hypothetical protein